MNVGLSFYQKEILWQLSLKKKLIKTKHGDYLLEIAEGDKVVSGKTVYYLLAGKLISAKEKKNYIEYKITKRGEKQLNFSLYGFTYTKKEIKQRELMQDWFYQKRFIPKKFRKQVLILKLIRAGLYNGHIEITDIFSPEAELYVGVLKQ